MRIHIYVEGRLVIDEEMAEDLEEAQRRSVLHADLVELANAAGKLWQVEITDPDGDVRDIRFGTDPTHMVQPVKTADQADLEAKIRWLVEHP